MTMYREVVTEVCPPGGVVVRDDGSPAAEMALRYALGEAAGATPTCMSSEHGGVRVR
jgi:hypothetical protein